MTQMYDGNKILQPHKKIFGNFFNNDVFEMKLIVAASSVKATNGSTACGLIFETKKSRPIQNSKWFNLGYWYPINKDE